MFSNLQDLANCFLSSNEIPAKNYDLLNHTLSAGLHNIWRKKAIHKLTNNPKTILDVATGTGDFAISAAKYTNANITAMNTNRSSQTSIWVEPATSSSSFTSGRAFLIGGNNTAGGYVELDAEL